MAPLTIRLKEVRLDRKLTQAQLADLAGVTRATVNRIEKRRPRSIDLEVLDKLAGALGIDPALLVVRVADEPPKSKARRGRG